MIKENERSIVSRKKVEIEKGQNIHFYVNSKMKKKTYLFILGNKNPGNAKLRYS